MTSTGPGLPDADPAILRYGTSDQQFIELWAPQAGTPRGYAILIHGGYWRAVHDATLMDPLVLDLVARGWAVANIEYRRVGNGGGWPVTLDDVRAAIATAKRERPQWCAAGAVVAVGHSVGGQLALLSADLVDAVVGLAPVTDMRRTDAEGLGENAAVGFMGAHYADHPDDDYDQASPIRRLPCEAPLFIIHGDADTRVPVAHSTDFVAAALAVHQDIDYKVVPGLGHLAAVDPAAPSWSVVVEWMEHRGAVKQVTG